MSEIRRIKNRSSEQKSTLYNIDILYKTRNRDINFFDDYSSIISETKNKTAHRDGIKILTPR